ncbi:MAG TPA: hypothetical protein DHW45_17095 [Candidatus Latescibacteria bacterium]|nr:hypothetical protein [Candidatus Latescibacterota bacterium]
MEESRGLTVSQFLRGILVAAILVISGWVLYTIRGTLVPFGIAFGVSYLLMPVVDYLESQRVNRMAGAALVLVTILGISAISIATFVPVLVTGMGSMKDSILGSRPTWSCVILNRGWDTIRLLGVKTSHSDFVTDGEAFPIDLAPGEQDTLTVEYAPTSMSPIVGTAVISIDNEGAAPLVLSLSGNLTASADPVNFVPSKMKSLGPILVAVSDSSYAFGRVDPGYLLHLKMQMATLQPQLEAAFPVENFDVAEEVGSRIQSAATDVLKETPALLGGVLSGITFLVIVPLVLFFLLAEGRSIKRGLIELIPNQYFETVLNLLHRIDLQLGGYIRGMVLSVVIISLLSIIGLRVIGLQDYLVVGTIAGVSNIIPYLGPLIGILAGTIAAVLQYSTLEWTTILPVVIVFFMVQLLDNVFVQPVVVAKSVNLHPLIVIFVVLVGSNTFGAVGMLLAVPLMAVIKVSVQTVYESLRSYSQT